MALTKFGHVWKATVEHDARCIVCDVRVDQFSLSVEGIYDTLNIPPCHTVIVEEEDIEL